MLHGVFESSLLLFEVVDAVRCFFQLLDAFLVVLLGLRVITSPVCDSAALVFFGGFVSHFSKDVLVGAP